MTAEEGQQDGPRQTLDLLGQGRAERSILDSCRSGRVAHAWLLSGPSGIGKATLAFRFARFALAGGLERLGDAAAEPGLFGPGSGAPAPETLDLPADDPVVRQVAAGSHPDLRVIERGVSDERSGKRKAEIPVADVRGLTQFMAMTATGGGWRVVIVDEAECMNRNAANALLKTLEEPPQKALLILVSHAPARLVATIRSRCRHLTMGPLSDDVVSHLLAARRPDVPEAERTALVRLAEGSIGRALVLVDQGGLEICSEMLALMDGLDGRGGVDVGRLQGFGDRLARDDQAWAAFADLLPWWLARMVRAGASGRGIGDAAAGSGALKGEGELARRLLAAAPLDRWVEVWDNVSHTITAAQAVHLDRKQAVIAVFHRMGQETGGV